jgi:hypothetical protein
MLDDKLVNRFLCGSRFHVDTIVPSHALNAAFPPQDGHAIAMGRTWKRLAKDWDGHAVGMVADVDCTTDEGKALCDLQVEAPHHYPSLKYGDPAALKAYSGNRTYEALSSFAKENLKPVCSVANVDLCDADKKAQIQMYTKLSVDELNAAVETEEEKLTKADEEFKAALATYQEDYKKLLKDKDTTVASVKGGLAFMKYLLAAKSKGEKKDEL